MINAMQIDLYRHFRGFWNSMSAGKDTKTMIIRLAGILDQLEPQGDDNQHTIWVKAKRPTFSQFYKQHYGDDTPYSAASSELMTEAKEYFHDVYPVSEVWYRLSLKHFIMNSGHEYYGLFIDNHYVFSVNDHNSNQEYDDTALLEWAIAGAESFVSEVRNGTLEDHILSRIPYCYRKGVIRRRDLWEADLESKKLFFTEFEQNDIDKFILVFTTGKPVNTPLKEMTARVFYESCAVIYHALGIHRKNAEYAYAESNEEYKHYSEAAQTPKEMYYSIADGRDDGLKNVPMDDPAAFSEWFHEDGPYFEFNGSHPWEIIPSMNISDSMHLYPMKDKDGWYFKLFGESVYRSPETVVAANALYDAGYPIEVEGYEKIAGCFDGSDYIPIVPIGEATIPCESIHLPKGSIGKAVAKKTIWEFDNYSLARPDMGLDSKDE